MDIDLDFLMNVFAQERGKESQTQSQDGLGESDMCSM